MGEETAYERDTLIIGAGPGGYAAAIRAAQLGQKVVLIDKDEWGGVCLNSGCIPSKVLIATAHRYEKAQASEELGITAENVSVDFSRVQQFKQAVIEKQVAGLNRLFKSQGIEMIKGQASFLNENEVRVRSGGTSTRYRFKHGIIATGSRPVELKNFPFGKRILSSTEALNLPELPNSLIIIGGGYIGIELGQMYAKFGVQVTILEGSDAILPGFDREMTKLIEKKLKKQGVQIVTGAMANHASQTEKQVTVNFLEDKEEKELHADYLLVTVGRRPNTDGDLGLERLPLNVSRNGLIDVDGQCRTSVPHIFAIGDLTEGPALAHKASYEGKVAAEVISGLPAKLDYTCIPLVVFSDPECASVGLTAKEAEAAGYIVKIGKFPFSANGRALALNEPEGFVKIVSDSGTGIVIGAQIVGAEAANLIAELGFAVEAGATVEDLALTIHAHPTLGELVMDAAEASIDYRMTSIVESK